MLSSAAARALPGRDDGTSCLPDNWADGQVYSLCAFSQVSAVSATWRHPLSMVSE